MELKVWVEGAVRVVCGLSMGTSCQEVVIALAQDIGQTGRYVLTLKVHGTERQLLKDECPLLELSKLGQEAKDAHFTLHRTGPTLSSPTDRHFPRPCTPDLQPPKHKDLYKALGSGHGTFPRRAKSNHRARAPVPVPSMEKEALLVQLLQQSRTLEELEQHMEALDRQTQGGSEQDYGSDWDLRDLQDQLKVLEERQRQNEEELGQEHFWMGQLEEENRRATDLSRRLEQLQWSVHHQSQRMDELLSHSDGLQQDVHLRSEENLRPLEQELQQRHLQGERITAALQETEQDIHTVDNMMKMQSELLEELSKELRQCNLQQFIQQASGSAPSDLTNLLPVPDIYLSNAGILE